MKDKLLFDSSAIINSITKEKTEKLLKGFTLGLAIYENEMICNG